MQGTTKPEGDDHGGAPKAAAGKGGGDVPEAAAEEVAIKAPVHCDGCGRKLRRSLQRLLDGNFEFFFAASPVLVYL